MSIEMLGPERSELTITPIDGRLAIIMTNAIAAASCRIEARSIVSDIVMSAARAIDVCGHCIRANVERVVLSNLTAVGTEQECRYRMRNRSIAVARPAQFEQCEHLVDFRGRACQKDPSILACAVALSVLRKFGGAVVLGIQRYRDDSHIGSQSGTKL